MPGCDFTAGDNDTVQHSKYSTQPDSPKTVSGPLDTPTTGTELDGRALSSGALGNPDNAQGKFPEGNPLSSPVEY